MHWSRFIEFNNHPWLIDLLLGQPPIDLRMCDLQEGDRLLCILVETKISVGRQQATNQLSSIKRTKPNKFDQTVPTYTANL
jgi:hypothetical protein